MSSATPHQACAPTPNVTRLVAFLDGPSSITRLLGRPNASTAGFIRRRGSKLVQPDGMTPFTIVGPNVYWLGLDENVFPSPSYPSQTRILEVLATAAMMGSTVVRSTTLGVSVGTPLSVWPARNTTNQEALDVISFVIFAAKRYGLRLIIPLTDQYDYYHGGHRTFLRWRSVRDSDSSVFYDTSSDVYKDFLLYLSTIFDHVNRFTQLAIKDDPTVMIWETGNELAAPPRAWTEAVANWIHAKAPNQLVASGRYGVHSDDLRIRALDAVTNHFYPPRAGRYRSDASRAASHGKVYYAGEFDWAGRPRAWGLMGWMLLPLLCALVVLLLGSTGRVFPLMLHWKARGQQRAGQTKSARQRSLAIRQSHIALVLTLLVAPITGALIYTCLIKDTGLESFLAEVERSSSPGSGDLYWSLFGHDDRCCDWVQHSDGFTLHYPGRTDEEKGSVGRMMRHAYTLNRQLPGAAGKVGFKVEGEAQDWFGVGDRIGIKCPQSLDN